MRAAREYRARVVSSEVPDVATAYVALCLRLRRLVPALVDPVAVDPALVRRIAAEPRPTAATLVREAGRLAAAVPHSALDPARGRFLAAQVRAVEWRARRLAGQRVPFGCEVRECLGVADVTGAAGDPDAYRAAHGELAALLPGTGSLAARMAAHRRRDAVAPALLGPAVEALSAALRARTAGRYGLPPDEAVEHRVVDGAPWRALQTYCGGHRSVVRVNSGIAVGAGRLPRLVAHETYPGHHVECCRGERAAARGRVELGVTVLGTPQTVVSEGLAECALDVGVGPGWGAWAGAVLVGAGVRADGALAERLDPVLGLLRRARLDAALLLHGAGRPTADAAEAAEAHLRRWLLVDAVRGRRMVEALARPLWRTQVVAGVEGVASTAALLFRPAVDPVTEHLRLLDDPPTPAALRDQLATNRHSLCDRR
jgi:hypothetical protein